MTAHSQRIIGLVPAAGQSSRISPLPLSKELFPIGFQDLEDKGLRPKVVCQYLLEAMGRAGVKESFLVLRPGKWDIPAYFGDGSLLDMRLAYLTVHVPFGVPFTLTSWSLQMALPMITYPQPDLRCSACGCERRNGNGEGGTDHCRKDRRLTVVHDVVEPH